MCQLKPNSLRLAASGSGLSRYVEMIAVGHSSSLLTLRGARARNLARCAGLGRNGARWHALNCYQS